LTFYYLSFFNTLLKKKVAEMDVEENNEFTFEMMGKDVFNKMALNGDLLPRDIISVCRSNNSRIQRWCNDDLFKALLLQEDFFYDPDMTPRENYLNAHKPVIVFSQTGDPVNIDKIQKQGAVMAVAFIESLTISEGHYILVKYYSGKFGVFRVKAEFIKTNPFSNDYNISKLGKSGELQYFSKINTEKVLENDSLKNARKMIMIYRSYGPVVVILSQDGFLFMYDYIEGWRKAYGPRNPIKSIHQVEQMESMIKGTTYDNSILVCLKESGEILHDIGNGKGLVTSGLPDSKYISVHRNRITCLGKRTNNLIAYDHDSSTGWSRALAYSADYDMACYIHPDILATVQNKGTLISIYPKFINVVNNISNSDKYSSSISLSDGEVVTELNVTDEHAYFITNKNNMYVGRIDYDKMTSRFKWYSNRSINVDLKKISLGDDWYTPGSFAFEKEKGRVIWVGD
jgi:hypothetical protein